VAAILLIALAGVLLGGCYSLASQKHPVGAVITGAFAVLAGIAAWGRW
jgi:hypothetical protein